MDARNAETSEEPTVTDRSGEQPRNAKLATARLRAATDAVQEALTAPSVAARDAHVRTALGEVVALEARTPYRVVEIEEQLTNALVAPDAEGPYFLNQVQALLNRLRTEIDPPAADG